MAGALNGVIFAASSELYVLNVADTVYLYMCVYKLYIRTMLIPVIYAVMTVNKFVVVSNSSDVLEFVCWLGRELPKRCIILSSNGLL